MQSSKCKTFYLLRQHNLLSVNLFFREFVFFRSRNKVKTGLPFLALVLLTIGKTLLGNDAIAAKITPFLSLCLLANKIYWQDDNEFLQQKLTG